MICVLVWIESLARFWADFDEVEFFEIVVVIVC